MTKRLFTNYAFDASAKTVTFTGEASILLEQVLLITNVTDGIPIYQFNSPTLGGSVASNVLTLDYDTTLMDDADDLQIFWDDLETTTPISAASLPLPTGAATEATLSTIAGAFKAEDSAAADGDLGLPILAMRYAADTVTTGADGDYANLKTDEEGRLKVATKPASFDSVSGNITTSGNSVTADVRRASNVVFHVKNTGSVTLNAGTFVFEASIDSTNGTDGTWFGILAARSNVNTAETSIALTGIAAGTGNSYSWEASVNAYTYFRLRCTVNVTASAIATWTIQRGSYATEPIPNIQVSGTQPVSGTVTATVAAATLNYVLLRGY